MVINSSISTILFKNFPSPERRYNMILKFLTVLEDPAHPLLGPTLWGLRIWGIWQSSKSNVRIIFNVIHLLATFFVLSQYIELYCIRSNLESALRNLSVTMLSTVCVVKAGTFIIWQKSWRSLFNYVSSLEKQQLKKRDHLTKKIIKNYTKYSRSVTYFYWALVAATVFSLILAPLAFFLSSFQRREMIKSGDTPYPEIMSSWVPFNKTKGWGYWIVTIIHSLICFYGGGIVANYDSNAVVLMSFFAGQLEILKLNCEQLFGNGDEIINNDEAVERIRICHHQHVLIIKYSKVLNSLLSPVMFLYIIICSLMICASAVQLTTDGITSMQQIWIAEYLVALVAQLFLYCWHSHKVLYMSLKVDEGVYSSAWWSQGVRVRRSVALLAGQLNKNIMFTAGPFTNLSVATFVAQKLSLVASFVLIILLVYFINFQRVLFLLQILKGSYSYYTLLSKRGD